MKTFLFLLFCAFILRSPYTFSQNDESIPSLVHFSDGIHHWNLTHKNRIYKRYTPNQYREIADNLIAYQNKDGGWPKNIDWLGILNTDSVYATLKESYKKSTLDNRNTFPQIRYLAQVYLFTRNEKYRKSAEKGLNYLLTTQKENGGWRGWDVDAITFNDDVTTGATELLRDIVQRDSSFAWLNSEIRERVAIAYKKAIEVILKCQIVQNGKKTAWGQQHDNKTYEPVKARSYELPGITAKESSEIVLLLMGIQHPSPEITQAVIDAVSWFNTVKLKEIGLKKVKLEKRHVINQEYPYDLVVMKQRNAKPIWARYYELSDNKPFMATRAGVKVEKLSDVNPERRTGYEWYGYWPETVLKKYPDWLKDLPNK